MLTKLLRLLATVLLALAAVAVTARPVLADPVDPVYCDQRQVPGCIVRASTPGQPGSQGTGSTGGAAASECHDPTGAVVPCYLDGRGSLGSDGCYYQPFSSTDPPPAGSSGPGTWYVRSCHDPVFNGPLGVPLFGNMVWLPDTAAPISPGVLAQQAVSRLALPTLVIRINPTVRLDPARPVSQISYVPSWLWVDAGSWGSRSATASVPGLAVTATARATRLVFTTGDGATVTCNGPGTPWTPGTDPAAASPTCGHTYTTPGSYTLQATATWSVTWAGGGATGTAGPLSTTAGLNVQVAEAGGLNTNGVG